NLSNTWKPYQVTLSERRPALEANKTLFNLVTCNRELIDDPLTTQLVVISALLGAIALISSSVRVLM
ncbi:MAG: hypothetical protein HC825_09595, partial [Oscillatoriales cyanobacterium RM1_1_9]|nr:hypothetical protein [Oscillatoriales cyanobacterium RM1_1_9]